jgi:hypothetical protein
MGLKQILISSIVAVILFLPHLADAYCIAWFMCPYIRDPNNERTRYLAINDAHLPGESWRNKYIAIEVAGKEDELGQALVCVDALKAFNKIEVESAVTAVGCEKLARGQVRARAVAPFEMYFDASSNRIRFKDGRGGRELARLRRPNFDHIIDKHVR